MFFSKLSTMFSPVMEPFSNASVMKVSPAPSSFSAVARYMHQLASKSMLSMSAPALAV